MKDKNNFPPIFLGFIIAFLMGVYCIYKASLGYPVPYRGITMEPWQVGGLGIGWVVIALMFLRRGMEKMGKNDAPINNDIVLKTTLKKKKKHHA